ncbi:cellulose binding domain-containing protein, partial [Micromonospora yangpuensis]
MKRRSRLRLWLASSLALAVSAAGAVTAVSAQAAVACRVTYTVTNQWQGGFGANVIVDNLGDPVNGWRLTWSFAAGQTVGQLWNGTATQSGTQVTVTGADWNRDLASGGSANFGFNGTWTSSNPVPTSFALNGVTCTGTTNPTTPPPNPTTPPPTTPPPTTPPPSGSFTNPVVWQDFADVDIIRVGDVYYMSASTMHYSPGAPVLRSYDLVNWEFAGHSVPRLDFGTKYDLPGNAHAYVDGIWASTLNYRPSNRTFYWAGCIDFAQTHIYTATAVDGTWNKHTTIPNCYYDAGMLIDDDDTMYVAYGNGRISVAQLSADGRTQVRNQQVYQTPTNIGTL